VEYVESFFELKLYNGFVLKISKTFSIMTIECVLLL